MYVYFFKQITAVDLRISDWSSDVCSSYLEHGAERRVSVRDILRHRVPHDADRAKDRMNERDRVGDVRARRLIAIEQPDERRNLVGPFAVEPRFERHRAQAVAAEIGSASCRERVCQYV